MTALDELKKRVENSRHTIQDLVQADQDRARLVKVVDYLRTMHESHTMRGCENKVGNPMEIVDQMNENINSILEGG